jgi:hypothetical protein
VGQEEKDVVAENTSAVEVGQWAARVVDVGIVDIIDIIIIGSGGNGGTGSSSSSRCVCGHV